MVTMFKMSISISVHKGSINELLLCPAAGGGANLGNAAVGLIRGEEKKRPIWVIFLIWVGGLVVNYNYRRSLHNIYHKT